jgi:serine/threonine protein kinase
MPADLNKARALFLHAVGQLPPEQWEAHVAEACGADAELRQQVLHFLKVHQEAGSFLERPAEGLAGIGAYTPAPENPETAAAEGPGTVLGPYKLVQEIGEGGMGTVWMAQQTEPVQRLVALKVVKPGMDSRQAIARFEAERQALALMEHPHIARVLDAGTTAGEPGGVSPGRPYFVMELVNGVPLTQYCDEQRLTPRQRLELFLPVCQAIQHAHQKGIIHRDIKPSNVLVARYDGQPVPKVIDFGIAKATGPQLTDKTLVTGFGAIVGTLEYMSPEQAQLNQLDIDTRCDVYSLGVLLYELLTGTTPLEKKRLKEAALPEVLRLIREEEPPKPSTRLSTTEELASIAAKRGLEPKRLSGLLRGELDWITMKCLEKDRNRRYETANDLARDLERYLHDEPVQAGPPSARYRLRKFVRKHRAGLAVAAVIVLLLVAVAVVSTWQAVRATQANTLATRRLAQVEKSNEILASIFADLDIRAVKTGPEPLETVLAKRLVKAAGELEAEAVGDPLAVAALQDRLGLTLVNLGHYQEAISLFVKERETCTAICGPDHVNTLVCVANLAEAYWAAGQPDKALPLFEEILPKMKEKLGPDHADTLNCTHNLALAYQATGQLNKAVPLLEQTLAKRKEKLGPDHPQTLRSMNNLAMAYYATGQLNKALPLLEQILPKRKEKLGSDHPETLQSMGNLAVAYEAAGQLDKALPLYEQTLAKKKEKLGLDHPDTLASMNNLAGAYQAAGQLDKALALYEQTLPKLKEKLGSDHPSTLKCMGNLAGVYARVGKFDRAEPLSREALARQRKQGEPGSLATASCLAQLGMTLLQQKKYAEAEPLLRECLTIREKKQPDQWQTFNTRSLLGAALAGQQNYAEAEPLLLQGYEGMQQREASVPADGKARLAEALERLVGLYEATGQKDKAAAWRLKLEQRQATPKKP